METMRETQNQTPVSKLKLAHKVPSTTEENCSTVRHTQHWKVLQHWSQKKDPKSFQS